MAVLADYNLTQKERREAAEGGRRGRRGRSASSTPPARPRRVAPELGMAMLAKMPGGATAEPGAAAFWLGKGLVRVA